MWLSSPRDLRPRSPRARWQGRGGIGLLSQRCRSGFSTSGARYARFLPMTLNRESQRARLDRVAALGDLLGDLDVGAAAFLSGPYLGLDSGDQQCGLAS